MWIAILLPLVSGIVVVDSALIVFAGTNPLGADLLLALTAVVLVMNLASNAWLKKNLTQDVGGRR